MPTKSIGPARVKTSKDGKTTIETVRPARSVSARIGQKKKADRAEKAWLRHTPK